jgi:putative membrane protein
MKKWRQYSRHLYLKMGPLQIESRPVSLPAAETASFVNTALIVTSGLFLALGYVFIRRKQIAQHRASMLAATLFAGLFLVVYVARYFAYAPKLFAGEGGVRVLYLVILISHTILAVAVGPLALVTLRRALKADYRRHRRIARVTLPIWLYVVVSGWTIYYMLHTIA